MFDDFQLDAMLGCCLFSRLSCVARVDISQLNILFRDLLHLPGQLADLCAILFIGRRDMKGKQMAQRVQSRMDLGAFAPFGSIVARSRTRFRRGL
jgi:hypothetical protein